MPSIEELLQPITHQVVGDDDLEALHAETLALWTPERMAAAKPIATPVVRPDDLEGMNLDGLRNLDNPQTFPSQPPRRIEKQLKGPDFPDPDSPDFPDLPPGFPHFPDGDFAVLGPYTSDKVGDTSRFPFAAVGKLFMTFPGGDYVGSAWVAAPNSIFTAGHCLYDHDAGGMAQNVMFVPQYVEGTEPIGRWVATSFELIAGWVNDKNLGCDVGGCPLVGNGSIGALTGTIGAIVNQMPREGTITSVGYPASDPFGGELMYRCDGQSAHTPPHLRMHNNLTPGCSGGPWVVDSPNWIADGLNSFRWENEPEYMCSPYFGEAYLRVYARLR